ncbi:MAG: DUF362 domain-containing protein, partial [Deltaproteobacteria bacterium]|nr:DUF362 domain-containing protein [Deltaproteobacteria bacterium]
MDINSKSAFLLIIFAAGFFSFDASPDTFPKCDEEFLSGRSAGKVKEAAEKPVFTIISGDYQEAGYNSLKALDYPFRKDIPVLIKPNIGGFGKKAWKEPEKIVEKVTNPAFVKGMIRFLKEKGVREIFVGEGKNVEDRGAMLKVLDVTGYAKMLEEEGVKFADLNYYGAEGEAVPCECAGSGMLIPGIYYGMLKNGVIISAAKLKVHSFATVSLSLKNLIGAAMFSGDKKPSLSRAKIHAELQDYEKKKAKDAGLFAEAEAAFGKRLAEISYLLAPDIGVIEGVRGCGGDGLTVCETEESP